MEYKWCNVSTQHEVDAHTRLNVDVHTNFFWKKISVMFSDSCVCACQVGIENAWYATKSLLKIWYYKSIT